MHMLKSRDLENIFKTPRSSRDANTTPEMKNTWDGINGRVHDEKES